MELHILQEYWNISPVNEPKKLGGYDSDNYLILTNSGEQFLFKKHLEENITEIVIAECEVLELLDETYFQKGIKSKNGNFTEEINGHCYRVVQYIDGDILANAKNKNTCINTLAEQTAIMHNTLKGVRNNAIESRKRYWDLQYFEISNSYRDYVSPKPENRLIDYFIQQYEINVKKNLFHVEKSILHGDINNFNIIVENDHLKGIIDFGDITYGPMIFDVAISLTYLLFDTDNKIKITTDYIKAYNKHRKLSKEELEALYYLIPLRCCQSILNAAYSVYQNPENKEYIEVSQKQIWNLLNEWVKINPIGFTNKLKKACGINVIETNLNEEQVKRDAVLSKALSLTPIKMEKAAFQYMYSSEGKTYTDLRNNIPHVGHCHPKVTQAGIDQMTKLNTNTRYYYDSIHSYSEKLLSKFPEKLNKVFFVNSGSAATDLALRIATTVTGNKQLMGLEEGYHGNTFKAIEISHYKYSHKGGKGQSESILKAPMPWNWKHQFGDEAGNKLSDLAISIIQENKNQIAGFIAEPIVGCGGQLTLPKNYLKPIYEAIRAQGGVCISDEVQTGFARLGHHWWGYEMYDVVPDIVVTGKCVGNGHPMAAVIVTDEIAEKFNNGMEFFSSFGGNPVSCAIGEAVLDTIEEEQLQNNAKEVGDYFIQQMEALQDNYQEIGNVRGLGFFLGLEFVSNRKDYNPNPELANFMQKQLRAKNILLGLDGPMENVLKIKPPLCFTKTDVDFVIENMKAIMEKWD